jgi:hypothetical protein
MPITAGSIDTGHGAGAQITAAMWAAADLPQALRVVKLLTWRREKHR